jgi:hypothetical protein
VVWGITKNVEVPPLCFITQLRYLNVTVTNRGDDTIIFTKLIGFKVNLTPLDAQATGGGLTRPTKGLGVELSDGSLLS